MENFCKTPAFMQYDPLSGIILEYPENMSFEWQVKWEHISFTNKLKSPIFHFADVQWHFNLSFKNNGDGGFLVLINDRSKRKILYDLCTLGMKNRFNDIFKEIRKANILDCSPFLPLTSDDCLLGRNMNILGEAAVIFFCKFHLPNGNCKANTTTETSSQTANVSCHEKEENVSGHEKEENVSGHEKEEKASNTCDLEGMHFLTKNLSDMFIQQKNCDVFIRVGQQEFKAHRLILSAWSPVFSAMFDHDMAESKSGNINVEDCEPDAFQDFLHYLYFMNTERINTGNVIHLYYIAADKYDVKTLRHQCVRFMRENLSVDSFCDVLTYALKYNEMELVKAAEDYFLKNALKILVEPRWQLFLKENYTAANELFIKYTKPFSQ